MTTLDEFLASNPDLAEKSYGDAMAMSLTRAFPCQRQAPHSHSAYWSPPREMLLLSFASFLVDMEDLRRKRTTAGWRAESTSISTRRHPKRHPLLTTREQGRASMPLFWIARLLQFFD
jgi:hypothetical protein